MGNAADLTGPRMARPLHRSLIGQARASHWPMSAARRPIIGARQLRHG